MTACPLPVTADNFDAQRTAYYAVIGNPIAHSLSPCIHAAFARQTGQRMQYEALLAPRDDFLTTVTQFRARGGCGMNVTVPFKLEAFSFAASLSARARAAGAVNTLVFRGEGTYGDNTDGAGLLRDLTHRLQFSPTGKRVLLLGAGGAARGAVLPLLEMRPAELIIANRTAIKAEQLAAHFGAHDAHERLRACGLTELAGRHFDLVINATSSSLSGQAPAVPDGLYAAGALAYDMMYAQEEDTPFLRNAHLHGAHRLADGLGMLVEQAAESFLLWRGVRPDTAPVFAQLRRRIAGA